MSLSRFDLEQIRNSTEFFDNYTSAQTQALAESDVDLQALINHMLSATRRILRGDASGLGDWKDTPAASLFDLNDASGILRTDQDQINSFIGRADGESVPTYSSTTFVTQNTPLEQAIGELDAAIGSAGTWQTHFNTGSGLLDINGAGNPDAQITFTADGKWTFGPDGADTVFSSSGVQIRALGFRAFEVLVADSNEGSTQTIPDSRTYTTDSQGRNLRVYRNGQLLLPGSGVLSTDENFNDYREATSATIVNNKKWKTNDIIQYVILG